MAARQHDWMQAPGGRLSPLSSILLLTPFIALLLIAFLYPILRLLSTSVWSPELTIAHYRRIIAEPLYLTIFARTLWIAAVVSMSCLLLGYPVAFFMTRLKGWRAGLVTTCVLIPLWTSVLVRSYAWVLLLQRHGVVNEWLQRLGITDQPLQLIYTEGAVLLAMTQVLLPFMVLPIYGALRNIPPDLILAAANLGAGRWATFRRVILPLSRAGVFAGVLMVFILSLGFYVTPAMVGGPRTLMIATLVGQQMTETLDWPFAGALATVLLAMTLVIVGAFRRSLNLEQMVTHGN